MSAAPTRRPQLSFDELQQLKWLLGALLSLIGVSTVFYMDVDAFTLMGLTIIATVATLVRPTLPSRTPAIAHTLAFPLIVAFFAADLWLKTEVLPAMVRLDILLLLYRNISYRQRRDDLQIIVLGLFLVIVAGVLTVSLTFAVQILIYTGCALALLLVITLSDAATGATSRPPLAPGEVPAWAQHADWLRLFRRMREVTDWRVVGLGAILFAGVVVVSAVLFLAIPRFQLENSMFLDRFISKKAKSGFSETIRIGDVTEIQQDNSVALSVDVSDQAQIPSTPYWRMLVLNQYDNGVFRISSQLNGQEFERERTGSTARGYATPRRGPAVYWTFYLESGVSRFLPLLGPFSVLTFREAQNFKLAPRLALVALREDPVTMTAYRIEGFDQSGVLSDPRYADKWRAKSPDERRSDIQLRVSAGERDRAALRGVVAEITNGETLAAPAFAERVGAWLKKNHGYSLSPVIPGNLGDPVVRWLTSREAGHCELFAGSFVLLARTAGFPARVVTGFRGGSWNGYSNNFTIRNADAHAWAEIFDERAGGWTRVDPLAPTAASQTDVRGEAAIVSRLDRSWKARLDSLRVFWYRRIVSFDQRSQAETLKAVRDATQNSGKRVREFFEAMNLSIHAWFARPWDFFRAVKAGITLVLILGMGWWMYAHGGRVWRELTMRRGPHGADPVRMEAGRWLRQLADAGARTPADESVVAELQRLRFGARDSWPRPEKVFRRARQAARERRRRPRLTPS
jgi:transglutaminase-like putative cysteine protease